MSLRGSVRAVQFSGRQSKLGRQSGTKETVTNAMVIDRLGPPVLGGNLNKKGKVNKSFAERWCELRRTDEGAQIDYFKKKQGVWKGTIVFDKDVDVGIIDEEGLPSHCFALQTKKRQYILQASSDDDVAQWIDEITAVVLEVRQSASSDTAAEVDEAPATDPSAPAASPKKQEREVPPQREVWSGDKTAQLGWESYESVHAELERVREDRRLLLKHTIKQAQGMDQIREIVLAMTKDVEDTEKLMEGTTRLMRLCTVDPDATNIEPSVVLPQDGDEQLDPNFDAIAVESLVLNLTSDPPVQCELDDDQKFSSKPLEGVERLPSIRASVAMDELGSSDGGDGDDQPVSLCAVPEFRQAFSGEQMLLAGYEALLCCTVIKPPEFSKRLADAAESKRRFQEAGQALLAAEQKLAELGSASEPDEEAIAEAAAALEQKKEAVAAASEEDGGAEPPEVVVARAEAQDYVETVLRPQFSLTSRAHRELTQALAVSSEDSDEDCAASAVGVGVPKGDLTPANVLQWRWRCVRFRRPPADLVNGDETFRSFKAFRSWVIRQLAMVLSGLVLHLQTHDDHVWSAIEGVALAATADSADADAQAFSSEDMASMLIAAARLIIRKLDYVTEFSLADYDTAVEKMSALVMTVLAQKPEDDSADGLDPWTSFVPLNCMLYEQLLSVCMSFNRNDSDAAGMDDPLLEDEDEDASAVNSVAVVNCLKQTWQPLRLSQAYHATLVVKNALNAFRKQPGKDVLVLLLDSVPDLKPIALGADHYTADEVETTRAAFRELKTYCRSQLNDIFKHFNLEQTEEVRVLSQLYFHTTIVPNDGERWGDTELDPELALTEAIQESVKAYYGRCKYEAENDSDDDYEEDEESKFIKLTLLAEKLDADLDQRIFSTLARCVEFPPKDGVPAEPEYDDGAYRPRKDMDPARDSLDIALQQLIQNARIDCANVIVHAHVDKSMAPCMLAMSQLDERLVELRQETWIGEKELHDDEDPPPSLLRLDALTAPVVGPWLEEQKESWGEWVTRSLKAERWVPSANGDKVDGVPVASSAVDMYSIVTAAMMNFEDSGMHGATSVKLREQFATAIVNTMESYVNEIEKSLGHMPRLEGSSKGKPAAPGRIKLDKKVPKKPREETTFKGTIEVYLRTVTLDEIIMRLNSLHYVQKHVLESSATRKAEKERKEAERAAAGGPGSPVDRRRGRYSMAPPTKDKPVFREFVTKDGAGKDLGLLTATLEQALRSVREYLSAKVVLYDQRGKLLDGLYMGLPAGANAVSPGMELDMNDLDDIMGTVMSNVVEGQRDSTCMELYRRFLESLEYVVLSHDEYRIYDQNLPHRVNADIEKLMEFFHCEGDGLAMEELQQMKMDLDQILTLCSWPSDTLVEKYLGFRQEEDELGSFNSRGGMGMYHLRKSDAIALILSHRRDDLAIQFFKKTVAEAKKGAKKMKKVTDGLGLQDQQKVDAPNLAVGNLPNPIKAGYMYKEGHRRKTFKKRYFVVWPRDYREMTMDAPVLFYYDSDQDGQKPKGTVSLANLKCRLPKTERKIKDDAGNEIGNCCFRADIEGAPDGHNKFIFATESTDDLIPWMEVLESASSHEDALGKQLRDRRQTGVGRRRESVVAQMNEGTPPPSGRGSRGGMGGLNQAQLAQLAVMEEEGDGEN